MFKINILIGKISSFYFIFRILYLSFHFTNATNMYEIKLKIYKFKIKLF
jgi:hypothetical protein